SYSIEGIKEADPMALELLQTVFDSSVNKSNFKITIGQKGDASVKSFSKEIPDKAEGYYLQITPKQIVLAGSDGRGTFYAVQTLLQLINSGTLPEVMIRDYPDILFRGVVEGFYGAPWSFEDRLRQIEFYGKTKLNTYIYGPKDDPYHSSPHWREPYPDDEADKIRRLVDASAKSKVDFVWAIHPGKDIQWTDADREAILNKFEYMYQLGVRSFAVFFDDISGVGTDPQKQAELLNYLDDRFISQKKDVTPLIMCPTEYNKSWSNPEKGYLKTLGSKLNSSIHIMWTGDRVIAEITEPSVHWINEQIGRPAYIWWNFPVSDYVRDHLLMGRVYGNDLTIGNLVSGFVANPMERAEASKVAIFSVADYTWNLRSFDSQQSWEKGIRSLMPLSYKALYKFSQHNSDLGKNGHGFRREESADIAPAVKKVTEGIQSGNIQLHKQELESIRKEFEEIIESADLLLASTDNGILIKEIEPWIYQFKNMGETGTNTLKLYDAFVKKDTSNFMDKYEYVKALRKINYNIDKSYNQNPYQPGVKTGSLVLQPFIDDFFEYLVEAYNRQWNTSLDKVLSYNPYKLSGTVAQIKNLPVQSKLNRISIAPVNEVVHWGKEEYIQLEMDDEYVLHTLRINVEPVSQHAWMKVEISPDGKSWKTVKISMDQTPIVAMLNPMKAKYLRFTNKETDQEIHFKGLELTLETESRK
ncbi:MAG: beta-N-acetylglucosaminidase domain-containing protein, partial [Bacteroidales bacterium]|nr:beta-N-acetylglucosaminidase domain-containing protein [Bacteroidales bacterium]